MRPKVVKVVLYITSPTHKIQHKEAAMSQKEMTSKDQRCISQCIMKHWSEHSSTPPEQREDKYVECLSSCRICS